MLVAQPLMLPILRAMFILKINKIQNVGYSQIWSIIASSYVSHSGADDILPYIIYTILLLSPKHMYSNLR